MTIKSVLLGLVIEEDTSIVRASVNYAVSLAAAENAHLTIIVGVPVLKAPSGVIIPQVRELLVAANLDRKQSAETLSAQIHATAAGVVVADEIIQASYLAVRDRLVSAARVADLIVLPQPESALSNELDVFQAILFGSGRPVLMVPRKWEAPATWRRITIGWDGGTSAARAVGDAMPFLEKADEVEIVCVAPDKAKTIAGGELAAHLARHCNSVRITELPPLDGDVAKAFRHHAKLMRADMRVMGAYGHSRLWEMVLGGVTRDMLKHADAPVFFSH